MHFDVIIIGSGPAGVAAAISCRQMGLHTLIIAGNKELTDAVHKEDQPVETVHPGLISVLTRLNAAHCIDIASQARYAGILVNDQYNPLGEDQQIAWQGYHINRALFDSALLQCATGQGITVMDNDTVTHIISDADRITGVQTGKGLQVRGRYLIDASGQKRMAGKQLRFKENFYSPPLIVWTGVSKNIPADSFLFDKQITRFISHAGGWTWLAPDLPGRCTWTRLALKGRQDFLPPAELSAYPFIPEIKMSNRRWRVFRPVCKEGILLCGDAAGIIDPAAGQGILNAMVSGITAAKTVKTCIRNPDLEALYLAQYDDWFISDYQDKANRLKAFYQQLGIAIF